MSSWWRHQMETFFRVTGLLCGEFTGHRWIPRSKASDAELFYLFFDLRLNERLSKQSWVWWFETPSWSLWRHCNVYTYQIHFKPNFTDESNVWFDWWGAQNTKHHYSGNTWPSWRFKSPATHLLFNSLFRLTPKYIKTLHYWPFVRGTHWSLVDSPHQGSVMRKALPCNDVIMQNFPREIIGNAESLIRHGR